MERAICENLAGNISASDRDLIANLRMAVESKYRGLFLRNYGITSSLKRQQGKQAESWQYSLAGLAGYWDGPRFSDRLYSF
jgi:hypothetical protein